MSKRSFVPLAALILTVLVSSVSALAGGANPEPPADGASACSKCVFIDVLDPSHDSIVGAPPEGWILPAGTSPKGRSVGVLKAGQPYLVTITGTVSYFALHPSLPSDHTWDSLPVVGTPVPPMFLSDGPGAPAPSLQTKAGNDYECVFAFPTWSGSPLLGKSVPFHLAQSRFSDDGGLTYTDPTPIGPACSPTHTYNYIVVGNGLEGFFRIQDLGPTKDNYGKYKICLEEARVESTCCKSNSDQDE